MIQAELIADTQWNGKRISTFRLTYPLFIHAQVLRHRAFSSSVSSARAIQPEKYRRMVEDNPVFPLQFGGGKKGMVAGPPVEYGAAALVWANALDRALEAHRTMEAMGVHQEVTNRLLAPFAHVVHLVTATEWDNWYDLRLADDAQPEVQELARQMQELHKQEPDECAIHLPFLAGNERFRLDAGFVGVARCAEVSYLPATQKNWDASVTFAHKLKADKHWSPFEHVARACDGVHRNFVGWKQFREEVGG